MRTGIIIIAAVFQVGVLANMGGEREYVLRMGKPVYLRTAPVDPRDAFRGDYVHLDYEISNVTADAMRDGLKGEVEPRARVYAVLDVDENRVGQMRYVTDKRPDGEIFIRGRIGSRSSRTSASFIRYGIEAYFVEQGKGQELERLRGTRGGIQVPLEMEIMVGSNGLAVLKGYRCGKLGIGVELKWDSNEDNMRGRNFVPRRLTSANLKLKNVSDGPLAIIDLPESRSIRLEPDLRFPDAGSPAWRWVNDNVPRKTVENRDVRVPKAGEEYEFQQVDFRDPAWFVTKGNEPPRTISDPNMGWGNNFRLVYRPPSKDECKHLDKANLVWHGYLRSSSFNDGGRVD